MQTTYSQISNTASSIGTLSADKYHNYIPTSLYKQVSFALFHLFNFITSESPHFYLIQELMTVIRLLQLYGPALFVTNAALWDRTTPEYKVFNVFSCVYALLPITARPSGALYYYIIYLCIMSIFYVTLFISAFYYKNKGKLPRFIPAFLFLFISTLGYYLQPVTADFIGETLLRIITNKTVYGPFKEGILAFISLCSVGLYTLLNHSIFATSAMFVPTSFITVLPTPQTVLLEVTLGNNFVMGITSESQQTVQQVISMALNIAFYATIMYNVTGNGSYVRPRDRYALCTVSVSGMLNSLVCAIFIFIHKQISTIAILIAFGMFTVIIPICKFIDNSFMSTALAKLSLIEENPTEHLPTMKAFNLVSTYSFIGLFYNNAICTDWTIFRYSTETWPNDPMTWLLFAKFAAIYPEEKDVLLMILHDMREKKIKGIVAKHIISDIEDITRKRESSMSVHLKHKLNEINKSVESTKHKLRHIWDLIIQGNTAEIEHSITSSKIAIEENESEYRHLLSQYPNCRFVYRSYARFKFEVCNDAIASREYSEKAKLMQRKMSNSNDMIECMALYIMPDLPKLGQESPKSQQEAITEQDSQFLDGMLDDNNSKAHDQNIQVLSERIENLNIPSIKFNIWSSVIVYILIYFVLFIALMVYAYTYLLDFQTTITRMYHICNLRYQLTLFPLQLCRFYMESINKFQDTVTFVGSTTIEPPYYLGNTNSVKEQLVYSIDQAWASCEELHEMRNYEVDNVDMQGARKYHFGRNIDYFLYDAGGNHRSSMLNNDDTVSSMLISIQELLDMDDITGKHSDSRMVNVIVNQPKIITSLTTVTKYIQGYAETRNSRIYFKAEVIMIAIVVITTACQIIINVIGRSKMARDRQVIFRALLSIPKNYVSAIADTLTSLKNNESTTTSASGDTEQMNKADETIMRVLTTAQDTTSELSNDILRVIFVAFFLIIIYALTCLIGFLFMNTSSKILDLVPHIDYVFNSISSSIQALSIVQRMIMFTNNSEIPLDSKDNLTSSLNTELAKSSSNFNKARFGDTSMDPFAAFHKQIKANQQNTCSMDTMPTTFRESYMCYPAESLYNAFATLLRHSCETYIQSETPYQIPLDDLYFHHAYNILLYFAANKLYLPTLSGLVDEIHNEVLSLMAPSFISCAALIVLGLVLLIIECYKFNKKGDTYKFALKLLLAFDPMIITQNPLVMEIISGNFIDRNETKKEFFYEEIIDQLPDAIIMVENNQIKSMNQFAKKQFNTSILTSLKDEEKFEVVTGDQSFEFTRTLMDAIAVYVGRNITAEKRYAQLIKEENLKSQDMLKSILPPNLVPSVMRGEKNISFCVQSASIVFLDVVEFTPWCSRNSSEKIMKTLNVFYKELDEVIARLPTMSKIKCIGDCYMAAGGIFSEVNQPIQHATEAVEFGLEAFEVLKRVNEEMKTDLQIRVGVNVGGPIVGGVIGCGKPTFEILGPAINLAEQMEAKGVPGKVQVSRPVFELIYGGKFDVKERGQVELKNGKAVTYIVSGKK